MITSTYFTLNARALVEKLGGVPAVQQMFVGFHFRPLHQRNIYKWIERNSIPSSRILELLWLIDRLKLKISLLDYLDVKESKSPPTEDSI